MSGNSILRCCCNIDEETPFPPGTTVTTWKDLSICDCITISQIDLADPYVLRFLITTSGGKQSTFDPSPPTSLSGCGECGGRDETPVGITCTYWQYAALSVKFASAPSDKNMQIHLAGNWTSGQASWFDMTHYPYNNFWGAGNQPNPSPQFEFFSWNWFDMEQQPFYPIFNRKLNCPGNLGTPCAVSALDQTTLVSNPGGLNYPFKWFYLSFSTQMFAQATPKWNYGWYGINPRSCAPSQWLVELRLQ